MKLSHLFRKSGSGQITTAQYAAENPDTTTRETFGDANRRVEIQVAAEAVLLGRGEDEYKGRVSVNAADLDRLKAAVGFVPGQP